MTNGVPLHDVTLPVGSLESRRVVIALLQIWLFERTVRQREEAQEVGQSAAIVFPDGSLFRAKLCADGWIGDERIREQRRIILAEACYRDPPRPALLLLVGKDEDAVLDRQLVEVPQMQHRAVTQRGLAIRDAEHTRQRDSESSFGRAHRRGVVANRVAPEALVRGDQFRCGYPLSLTQDERSDALR